MIGITHRAYADFARLCLKYSFDRSLEGVLQRNDAVGFQTQGLDRLDVECVGEIGRPELYNTVVLAGVWIRFRHRTPPVA